MDKSAYHLNKKKTPSDTEGKFLYYYSCADGEIADKHLYGKDYKVIEVTEEEWQTLIELDRLEYNNHHAETRSHDHFDEENEPSSNITMDKKPNVEEAVIEKLDDAEIFKSFTKEERVVAKMCVKEGETQKEAAKRLKVSQGYVSSLLNNIKTKLNDDEFDSEADKIIWQSWYQFLDKGYCDNYMDFFVDLALRQLEEGELYNYFQWFFSIGEMLRHVAKYAWFDIKNMPDDIINYINTAPFKEKERFVERYGNSPIPIQALVVRMNKEMWRRQKLLKGQRRGDCYNTLTRVINKIAKNENMTVDEYCEKILFPKILKHKDKRWKNVEKRVRYLMTKPKYQKLFN